jgi:2,3-bisphosphoglycerate-independent phosphoglycerate mutase
MTTKPRNRPCIILIRDGWGENPDPAMDHANAIKLAQPPVDAMLRRDWPMTLIETSGFDVGLPEGTMGNSEVGHQNIGAGRIVDQDSVRITKEIRDGQFYENAVLKGALTRTRERGGRLHVLGLASDIGVHSLLEHLYAVVRLAARLDLRDVFVHCFMDGRDSPPTSGAGYVEQIQAELGRIGVGQVASLCGRYWAMDRDNRWDRVEKAYRMLVDGQGAKAEDPIAALKHYYENPAQDNLKGDEFMPPTLICDDGQTPRGLVRDGDAIVFFNFRGDRPREITKAFRLDTFPFEATDKTGATRTMGFARETKLDLEYVTMTAYQSGLPVEVAYPKPPRMENIAGAYLSGLGLRQFRCAETEKYAHVTFFFNDYREEPFPGEERQLVASPNVATYDLQPEMSAPEVTAKMVARIKTGIDDFIVLNYANPDMVGHTGSIEAAVKACRAVDAGVGEVFDAIMAAGGCGIITADHGNFEQMIDPKTGGPHTAHTVGKVPLHVFGAPFRGVKLRSDGRLADVVPTALAMLGLDQPAEMTGASLIVD